MKKIITIVLVSIVSFSSKAQDFEILLEAGASDANTLLSNYFEPAFTGFGYGLNGGWFNTAKTHKNLGFDLTVTANLALIPDDALFYTFNNADYRNARLSQGTSRDFPTFFGPTTNPDDIGDITFNPDTENEIRFSAPQGFDPESEFGLNAVPVPMAQLGIGIYKNTDLKVRWTPEIDLDGNGTFKLFGLGVLHDVKQWIPGLKLVPIDLSAFVGFTNMKTEFFIDEAAGQRAQFDVNGLVIQGLISKKFSILTVYGGLGFSSTKTSFALLGDYDIEGIDLPTDPIDFDFNTSSLRATAGLRIKLAILTLHGDYTLQEYNTLTAGVGFSIR